MSDRPPILEYAPRLPRDWIDRYPWIVTAAAIGMLLMLFSSIALFVSLIVRGL